MHGWLKNAYILSGLNQAGDRKPFSLCAFNGYLMEFLSVWHESCNGKRYGTSHANEVSDEGDVISNLVQPEAEYGYRANCPPGGGQYYNDKCIIIPLLQSVLASVDAVCRGESLSVCDYKVVPARGYSSMGGVQILL